MRNIIISILVYLFLATLIVLITEPKVHKQVNINNSDVLFATQSFSDKKDIIVNNVQPIEISKKAEVAQSSVPKEIQQQTVPNREDYMNKLKERAQKEYGDDYYNSGTYITKQKSNDSQNGASTHTKVTKSLTEMEEILAWNKWHADIATELLKRGDVQHPDLPIKDETRIGYSFMVNYQGEISSIAIDYVDPPSEYTNVSKLWIPILQSMNHDPILKFPEGTRRTRNKFSNRIRISRNGRKYATPNDFNDYEIIKYRSVQ